MSGQVTVSGPQDAIKIAAASFKVDVSKLTSDRPMRDQRIRSIGLQSDQYPTASFKLAKPLTLPASFRTGRVAHVSATGVFNIHGTSKREAVPIEMALSKSGIEATGSITFPWSEFGMTAPSVGGFVNVADRATMEFDLHLQRA
jgi:polyisoprenoid-binding protein YceI